jgi:hypothetical protein
MKLHWIVDAERSIPALERGVLGRILSSVDGKRNWHSISTAPFNQDLELMVLDHDKNFVIPFPCRQTTRGWIDSDLDVCLNLNPTTWRLWAGGHPGAIPNQ